MGEKNAPPFWNKIPPEIPGQSREIFVYVFFSLCVFFAPQLRHSGKRPIKVRKWSLKEAKRPINANAQFSGTPPWWKTAPLKRPIKRSLVNSSVDAAHFSPPLVPHDKIWAIFNRRDANQGERQSHATPREFFLSHYVWCIPGSDMGLELSKFGKKLPRKSHKIDPVVGKFKRGGGGVRRGGALTIESSSNSTLQWQAKCHILVRIPLQ